LLALSTVACVQRVEPFYEARITAVVPPAFDGDTGWAHGTVTNLADFPMYFVIHLAGAPSSTQESWAQSVLSGQTAVWRAPFSDPAYTPRIGMVEYYQAWRLIPAHAQAVITGVGPADVAGWSKVSGTVTNTGTVHTTFAIEVQTANGEVSVGHSGPAPGETATWDAVFHGIPQSPRIVRVLVPPGGPMVP
jgi:hypothetical protein